MQRGHLMFESIQLENLLSFGPGTAPLPLEPLNVLVGPNGSGKSNVLEALSLLQAAPVDIARPIREGGGVLDWLHKGAPATEAASIKVALPNVRLSSWSRWGTIHYQLAFESVDQRLSLAQERIDLSGDVKSVPVVFAQSFGHIHLFPAEKAFESCLSPFATNQSILSQLKDPKNHPEITFLGEILRKIQIYREWSFGRTTPPRLPQKTDLPNDFLLEDASNLGLVLNRLRREPEAKRKLLEELRNLYEGIDDFDVQIEAGTVQVFLTEGRRIFPATRLSDGTLRYLCLLAILCHPTPPPLVCLEEPELGLHPDVLPGLARLLLEASERCQIIATTHSDVLVSALSERPSAVVVCEKHDGQTRLQRLDEKQLAPWLATYRLGQLWMRGDLGGTRW